MVERQLNFTEMSSGKRKSQKGQDTNQVKVEQKYNQIGGNSVRNVNYDNFDIQISPKVDKLRIKYNRNIATGRTMKETVSEIRFVNQNEDNHSVAMHSAQVSCRQEPLVERYDESEHFEINEDIQKIHRFTPEKPVEY